MISNENGLTSACSKWLLVSRQLLTHLPRHSEPLLILDVRHHNHAMRLSALSLIFAVVGALNLSSTNAVDITESFSLKLQLDIESTLLSDNGLSGADAPAEQPHGRRPFSEGMISMMPIIVPNPDVEFALRIIEPPKDFSSSMPVIKPNMITPNIIIQPDPTR